VTYTHERNRIVDQKRQECVCDKKIGIVRGELYMYSNRHRLNASSTARDTYTRKKKQMVGQKRQERVCGKKERIVMADYTCVLICIA